MSNSNGPFYPNLATTFEIPFLAVVQRIDPRFQREKVFELTYDFAGRRFYENAYTHGAYDPTVPLNATTDQVQAAFEAANGSQYWGPPRGGTYE